MLLQEMPYAAKAFMELHSQPSSHSKEGTFPWSGRQTMTAKFGFYMLNYSHFLNWLNSIQRINDLCYTRGKKSPSGFPTGRMAFLQEIQVILEEKTQLPRILTFLSWLSYSSRSSPVLLNLMGALNIKSGKKRGKKRKYFLVQGNWCWPLFPKKGEISTGCTRGSAALFSTPDVYILPLLSQVCLTYRNIGRRMAK